MSTTRRSRPCTQFVLRFASYTEQPDNNVIQKETELQGLTAVRTLADLPDPAHTSVSVITGPKVRFPLFPPRLSCTLTIRFALWQITLGLLEQAKALGVPQLWLQPGADDESVVQYINENGLADRVVYGGPCVLVEGEGLLQSVSA